MFSGEARVHQYVSNSTWTIALNIEMALSSLKRSGPRAGCVSNTADGENVYKYINFVAQIYAKHIFAQISYRIFKACFNPR